MRIKSFRIENFRNIQLAECEDVPNFMVICGGNGCGKSALLDAIITAKERAGTYDTYPLNPWNISADASKACINLTVSFSEEERNFASAKYREQCPETDEIIIELYRDGTENILKRSRLTFELLRYYSQDNRSIGFFDYITSYRNFERRPVQVWPTNALDDSVTKQTFTKGASKFQFTKDYLFNLKMRDLQNIQNSIKQGIIQKEDSLDEIRQIFQTFFFPMRFDDVDINQRPFKFIISTPSGDIDIDDLSSGEKEVFNVLMRFHQLKPHNSVILFDEADSHLHPDLERRYLQELRKLAQGSQLLLTTHSPEMMIAAGNEALYTITKHPASLGENQLVKVSNDAERHEALVELMGSRGIISLNQRIVFIEGQEASADRAIYEELYPPQKYHISFVPAGNASTVSKTAEQVNLLLTTSTGFQQYFSIVDGDINITKSTLPSRLRLYYLPVYHVENFLLNDQSMFDVTKTLLRDKCPYQNPQDVEVELKKLVMADAHLQPFINAMDTSLLEEYIQTFRGSVRLRSLPSQQPPTRADAEAKAKNILSTSLTDGTWRKICKGRDLLTAYCHLPHMKGISYEHFKNSLIEKIKLSPPPELDAIMQDILRS